MVCHMLMTASRMPLLRHYMWYASIVCPLCLLISSISVTLTCAGITCLVDDVVEGCSVVVERVREAKPQMKDRVVKLEWVAALVFVSSLDLFVHVERSETYMTHAD